MADRTVITTAKGARYHVDESCHLWSRGRENSTDLGRQLHDVQRLPEADAVAEGKTACRSCGHA